MPIHALSGKNTLFGPLFITDLKLVSTGLETHGGPGAIGPSHFEVGAQMPPPNFRTSYI